MDKFYSAGGTMQICPYGKTIEIVTFTQAKDGPCEFHCNYSTECTLSPCPLAEHLKGYC